MWKYYTRELSPWKTGFIVFVVTLVFYGLISEMFWGKFIFSEAVLFALVFGLFYVLLTYAVNKGLKTHLKKKQKKRFFPKRK